MARRKKSELPDFQIIDVDIQLNVRDDIVKFSKIPIITIEDVEYIDENELKNKASLKMQAQGWKFVKYDEDKNFNVYRKQIDVTNRLMVTFSFVKKTDTRDSETFGFNEGKTKDTTERMDGTITYPVPDELIPDALNLLWKVRTTRFTLRENELKANLIKYFEAKLVEDEYSTLEVATRRYKEALIKASKIYKDKKELQMAIWSLRIAQSQYCEDILLLTGTRFKTALDIVTEDVLIETGIKYKRAILGSPIELS